MSADLFLLPPSETVEERVASSSSSSDPNPSHITQDFNDSFPEGKEYKTLEALRQDIDDYGKKYNIVMSVKNSNYRSIHLWCKHGGQYRKGKKKVVDADTGTEVETARLRQKRTQRQGCLCFVKARYLRGLWVIDTSFGEHNHVLPANKNVYSIHRKQPKETAALIKRLLNDGQKVSDIIGHLSSIGITNIIKKDIENMQQQLRRKKKKQAEASTIVSLPIMIQTPTPTPEQSRMVEPSALSAEQIKSILNKQLKVTGTTTLLPEEQQKSMIIDLEKTQDMIQRESEVSKAVNVPIEQEPAILE
ncbi:hypothetical protein K501DRAFT_329703 [Backusella circina FSU 941]|nr:hypothetical protein K501DRAFT_329703 [Backusella circina FSU 941]